MIRSSIRARWVVVTLAVVLVAIAATAVLAAQQAANNTEDAVTATLETRDELFEKLIAYRDVTGGWDDVDVLVDAVAETSETRIALTDERGRLLADSAADGTSLPSVPVGFVDEAFGTAFFEPPDVDESFENLESFVRCLDEIGASYDDSFGTLVVDSTRASRRCVAEEIDAVIAAGGSFAVTLVSGSDGLAVLSDALIACFEELGVPFVLETTEEGVARPEPLFTDDPEIGSLVFECLEEVEDLDVGRLIGFDDGAVVFMDVDGADPFSNAADPFDPTVLVTVGAVAALSALAAWFAATCLVRPIRELTRAAAEMGEGDLDRRANIGRADELGDLGRAFDRMADQLAEDDRQRRRMTSDVAHELRTPLANIRGYLEGVQDGVIDLDRAVVDRVHEEAIQLQHLVDDLQTLSLVESGRLAIASEEVDVSTAAAAVVAAHGSRANEAGVRLTLTAPSPLRAAGDQARIRQVLTNLVDNAIRHTPPDGEVTVALASTPEWVTISVLDTGSGIDAPDVERIFERFYRADAARTRHLGGSGLGLAISHELAVAMDGRLTVRSEPGSGAEFVLWLPPLVVR